MTNKQTNKADIQKDKKGNILLFWKIYLIGIGSLVILFLLAAWGVFGDLPDHTTLENPQTDLATEIVSSDGVTLGKFYKAGNNRTPVTYEDLPHNLIDALVSTEDERFWDHSGIDGYGTARAVAYAGTKGGASTITQQLAKLYFTKQASGNKFERLMQKIREWIIATRLEKQYTKKEIITQYLNQFDFLRQAIGIRSAARIYFGKEPKDLKVEESAVLVAMLKNPSLYNPASTLEQKRKNALNRRNQVFFQMERNGSMTAALRDSLKQVPIRLDYKPESHNDGLATYFRGHLKKWLKKWGKTTINPDTGKPYDIYDDGLKVNVTIDSRMQAMAENAVVKHMANLQKEFDSQNVNNKTAPFRGLNQGQINSTINKAIKQSERWRILKADGKTEKEIIASFDVKTDMRIFTWQGEKDTIMTPRDSILHYKKFFRTGVMSMEPQTGFVKVWVGGINHKHFKFDHVEQGKRQAGSTFKPFLYSTAVDLLHYSPCKEYPDGEYTIPAGKWNNSKDWTPKDSGGDYGSLMTLTEALAKSKNTISARLVDEVGPQPVLDRVSQLGIDTEGIEPFPSIALGTPEVNLFEMVGAFSVFANGGIYNTPVLVTSIEDKNGSILYQYTPESRDVMNEETAYVTVNMMKGVVEHGSGSRLRGSWRKNQYLYKNVITGYPYDFKNEIAGKTGTTQNNSDGWFMGMVPNLVTGVWVGADDRSVHFARTKYGQGATMALPIWGSFMKDAYATKELGISTERFKKPKDLSIEIDCDVYKKEKTEENSENKDDTSDELEI